MFYIRESDRQKTKIFYIFHAKDDVVISLFLGEKYFKHFSVSKRNLGEELVEKFEQFLKNCNFELNDVSEIYLNNSFSTWNASRLVVLFVKTICTFSKISLFLKQETSDKENTDLELKRFNNSKKNYKYIEDVDSFEPLYKKCTSLNI